MLGFFVGIKAKGRISKNERFKKKNHAKFSVKRTFLIPWYAHVSGSKKCSFYGKFGVLCFLETPVFRFAFLPYYRRLNAFSVGNLFRFIERKVVLLFKNISWNTFIAKDSTSIERPFTQVATIFPLLS